MGAGAAADVRVMRAYEQRQRLAKDLQKAEAREAARRKWVLGTFSRCWCHGKGRGARREEHGRGC